MCLEVSFTRQGQVRWGRRWLKQKGDRPLAVDPLLLNCTLCQRELRNVQNLVAGEGFEPSTFGL